MLIPPKIQLPKLPTPLHLPLHPVLTAFQPELGINCWPHVLAYVCPTPGEGRLWGWWEELFGLLCVSVPGIFFQKFATSAL